MEERILKCLNNIELSENNILNGSIFTCKVNNPNSYPCQNCLSCKLIVLQGFSISLLNHMTDIEVKNFIKNCSKDNSETELVNILEQTLYPLNGKDRLYSLSRTVPSLNTDLTNFSIKNITIDKAQLENVTQQISCWISNQPDIFRIQFIVSLLSHLKSSVLSEIYCSICKSGASKNLSYLSNETFMNGVNNSISNPGNLLKEMDEINSENKNLSENQIDAYLNSVIDNKFQIDFISNLPVYISKRIINMLDEKSLTVCSDICENWKKLVIQVRKEDKASIQMKEQAIMLQSQKDGLKSVSSTPADPRFARDTDVTVPHLNPSTHKIMYIENKKPSEEFHEKSNQNDLTNDTQMLLSRQVYSMDVAYKDIITKNIITEERNVFCGSYSVLMIFESSSKSKYQMRTISYNGGQLVAVAGANKIIQFIDKKRNQSELMKNRIRGHAGSINVIRLISKPNTIISRKKFTVNSDNNIISHKDLEVLSGSYDTTIRRWDSITGKCLKIYNGHSATISDLDIGEEIFASGSFDGTCKLWRYQDKHSFATMRHKHPVTAVAISNKLCISGDLSGLIKVWNIQNGDHIKNLSGHFKEISAIRVDDFHIVSASHDSFVMLWSTVGDFNSCIGNFRHPQPVLCMEFMYLRAITGCADGKIRIWNVLNGQTIRIIRGNSKSDPILNLIAHEDTIIINTVSNILVLNFEPIDWIYDFDKNNNSYKNLFLLNNSENEQSDKKSTNFQHINQRCMRSRFAGNIDPRIFITPTIDGFNINSKVHQQHSEFINTRSFSNGTPLTRSTAWIVSPTLYKPNNITKKPPLPKFDVTDNTNFDDEFKITTELSKEPVRGHTESQSMRRVSYGFERQDHLMCNVDLKEVKQTLRQHIRSPPNISAEAMPEFIKTMVSQLKTAGLTGRPISAISFNRSNRPSSGPSKVDSKSKIGVEEIKNVISPLTNQSTNFSEDLINFESLSKHQLDKSLKEKTSSKVLVHSNIKSSSVVSINQPIIGPFFVPPDYRKKLSEKKSEFDQRQQTNSNQSVNNFTENSKKLKYKLLINKLNLQTYENSQHELEKIEHQRLQYEMEQKAKATTEYHLKWLKRATESPVLKYEKDAIMKRPRSAKI